MGEKLFISNGGKGAPQPIDALRFTVYIPSKALEGHHHKMKRLKPCSLIALQGSEIK